MSVLTMPSSRPASETELEAITQLAVSLSGQLTRVHEDGIAQVIAEALRRVAAATRVDGCQFVELDESGTVGQVFTSAGPALNDRQGQVLGPDPWLVARLTSGEVVAVSQPEDLPREATSEWEPGHSRERAPFSACPRRSAGACPARWCSMAAGGRADGRRR